MSLEANARMACLLLPAIVVMAGCTGIPDGIRAVDGFDLERYYGTWYEVARLDHRFERGLSNVTATYGPREDGGVTVVNRGYDAGSGTWDEARGRAYLVAGPDVGRLKVSFFGPFFAGYNIIELDRPGYRYSMVTGPDRSYLWILSRTPELDPDTLKRLVDDAAKLGFATDDLIFVEHDAAP